MSEASASGNKAASAVAMTASSAALACGVCCVVPLALPAAILGSVGGILAWFANAYRWLTPVAILAVAVGWFWVGYQAYRTGHRPGWQTLGIMGFATIMGCLAWLWPRIEPVAIGFLRG
ncbi:hypothetical protein AA0242T_3127 [Acetobacter aceti NRIC 0242]|jgi:hypothetical protein|uniref:Mercuric transport protein MerT n=6 Tax=Acetobacteraceae TaxID=433 RepID=A0AA35UU10_9PROT|nr:MULTISPECIES: hypothetical protein [Acetobacteraceae]GBO82425.1 hypothetical protein AA0242T_3127 [Acetobacter aceti NRIC 0242]KXV49214.1 hypothetical protein AD945_04940 [Gluconobacter albidus]NHN83170.1 hypothetical protein [Acetobacter musti]NHN89891.1 hypothetical protein [Acetobacter conturbans]TCS29578.1 hypothetical protein EDC31_106149 [Acidomonas methanolica]